MRREVKIGIFAVVMIGAAWGGVRFLKGIDIFSRNVDYYAAYDQINGVQSASPIMMKGVKIGTVTGITFDPARNDNVVLRFSIKHQYRIPSDSEAKIFSNGLMGAKAIEITYGNSKTFLQKGDTLRSSRDRDLMDVAGSELDYFKQKFSQVVADVSRTLGNINILLEENRQSVNGTMRNLDAITGDVHDILAAEKGNLRDAVENFRKFSDVLGDNAPRIDSIIGGVNRLTTQLSEEDFAAHLAQSAAQLNDMLAKINSDKGTLGMLMNDPELYVSLNKATENLAVLLANLKEYPGRYVHFSLFGRSPEKMQEKAEKKAAKQAARAERDSLKRL